MNRLFEIATRLGEIALSRHEDHARLDVFTKQIKEREIQLIPEGGWPGSNDTQRKAAETTTKANDEPLALLNARKEKAQDRLNALEAEREALLAERDAWQWTIRDQECWSIGGSTRSIFDAMKAFYAEATQPEDKNHADNEGVTALTDLDDVPF